MRAEPFRRHRGHRTVDAELASHVVGRRHHAPAFRRSADDDRFADQFRPVPLLDGSVEGVHVDVQDHGATTWAFGVLADQAWRSHQCDAAIGVGKGREAVEGSSPVDQGWASVSRRSLCPSNLAPAEWPA